MTKVILFIATSQDNFIADIDGGVDWLPEPKDDTDNCGYENMLSQVSMIAMGRKSYQQILGFGEWAWEDKTTYVFTSQPLTSAEEHIVIVKEDPKSLMQQLEAKRPDHDMWLLGGAELIRSFAKEKLIDECIITTVPVAIGEGIPLDLPYEDFTLTTTTACGDGIIQKCYTKKAN
jgi:dihydrofolate reductase